MRSVYGALAVHSFDVLTDILVIIQWFQLSKTPKQCHENVDPQIMAWSGIAIIITSKTISTFAIFLKERNIRRAILQFIDFLIFEEIYESHQKIISGIKHKKSIQEKEGAIESTLSFKYIRNFEAIFESIPQAVLQLVFIMRIESVDNVNSMDIIFILSIIQSIISMTNSILNNDYTRMQDGKWKRYKQRLPPTFEFFKHALCRLCEVIYRIGLLALFWTICGGLPFGIMLAWDLVLRMLCLNFDERARWSGDTLLLSISTLIVIPSEVVYGGRSFKLVTSWCDDCEMFITKTFLIICCCLPFAAFLTSFVTMIRKRSCDVTCYMMPTSRIGVSMIELIFMIIYGIYGDNGQNKKFLLSSNHGLYIFIVTCICFFIYSQYEMLFPDLELPLGVKVRSKWGYAYSNELSELRKVKVRTMTSSNPFVINGERPTRVYEIKTVQQFWDEPCKFYGRQLITAGIFALAKENYEVISWLEQQGAIHHKGISVEDARKMLFYM